MQFIHFFQLKRFTGSSWLPVRTATFVQEPLSPTRYGQFQFFAELCSSSSIDGWDQYPVYYVYYVFLRSNIGTSWDQGDFQIIDVSPQFRKFHLIKYTWLRQIFYGAQKTSTLLGHIAVSFFQQYYSNYMHRVFKTIKQITFEFIKIC